MKKYFSILVLLIALSSFSEGHAQKVQLDSLWKVWENESLPDSSRLTAMHAISWDGYLFTQPDSSFYFAQLQFDLANRTRNEKSKADALNTQGVSFAVSGDNENAIVYFSKSLNVYEGLNDKQGIASSLNNLGLIYKDKGDYANAIDNYTRSLIIAEEINDKRGISNTLTNIGSIYQAQKERAKALNYYERSLIIYKERDDKSGVAVALNNIGGIYMEKGDLDKSLKFYNESLAIKKEIEDEKGIAATLNNLGNVYKEQGNSKKAIELFNESLMKNQTIGYKRGVTASYINLGDLFLKLEDYKKAIDFISRGLILAIEVKSSGKIKDASFALYKAYKQTNENKKALEMYELFTATRDSLNNNENKKEIIRQEYRYTYEKQAAADSIRAKEANKVKDALLKAEKAENKQNQIEANAQKQLSYFLYVVLGLALLFGGFIFSRFRITNKQKEIIEEQKHQVDKAFDQLGEKNTEILDSIAYAKRIQNAILPPDKLVKEYLQKSFILYKPKDIVAGDFYWMETIHLDNLSVSQLTNEKKDELGENLPQGENIVLFAAADCTGHGVPGAMVSVICNNALNRSVREYELTDPGEILNKTREIVIQEFEKSEEDVKDGMDIALCSLRFDVQASKLGETTSNRNPPIAALLQYAGAHNPLWIIRKGEIIEIKANKQPIGKFDKQMPYTTHSFELQKGDTIYIFSDGFVDQFGGEKGKKFKARAFRELLLSIQDENMEKQHTIIDKAFESWRGDLEQIDDVCIIGVRV